MGFRKPDLNLPTQEISRCLTEIRSPYNDGFVQMSCKKDLYLLKCWLEDEYSSLPKFSGEEQWEQQRLIEILKR